MLCASSPWGSVCQLRSDVGETPIHPETPKDVESPEDCDTSRRFCVSPPGENHDTKTHSTGVVDLDKDLSLSGSRYGNLLDFGIGLYSQLSRHVMWPWRKVRHTSPVQTIAFMVFGTDIAGCLIFKKCRDQEYHVGLYSRSALPDDEFPLS